MSTEIHHLNVNTRKRATAKKKLKFTLDASKSGTEKALAMLVALSDDCRTWEGDELAHSNARLYELLTRCYRFYLDLKTSPLKYVRAERRNALDTFIEQRG